MDGLSGAGSGRPRNGKTAKAFAARPGRASGNRRTFLGIAGQMTSARRYPAYDGVDQLFFTMP
ncbi:hypothetical protein DK254_14655 [Pseudomonas sp. RW407]|nr:hypothetical protein DK254_14655 [Pseudomonas sp. RW407]